MDTNKVLQILQEATAAEAVGNIAEEQRLLVEMATAMTAAAAELDEAVDAQKRLQEVQRLNAELAAASQAEALRREAEAAAELARTQADAAKATLTEMLAGLGLTVEASPATPIQAPVFERHVSQTYNQQPADRIVFDDDDDDALVREVERRNALVLRAWRMLDNTDVNWGQFKSLLKDAGEHDSPHFYGPGHAARWMRSHYGFVVDLPELRLERLEREEEETRTPAQPWEDIFGVLDGDDDDETELSPREIPAVESVVPLAPPIDFGPDQYPDPAELELEPEEQSWLKRLSKTVKDVLPQIGAHMDETHP